MTDSEIINKLNDEIWPETNEKSIYKIDEKSEEKNDNN